MTSDSSGVTRGPVEQLLSITEQILKKEQEIKRTRLIDLGGFSAIALGPVALLGLFVVTVATWRVFDMRRINAPFFPIVVIACVGAGLYIHFVIEGIEYTSSAELKLELTLLKERRRLRSADLTLDPHYARSAYKEQMQTDLRTFKRESKYYRRIHNWFQSIIIIGSLAITTISGIALNGGLLEWLAVGTSVAVGLAAGFTGYFKFRERSFYLQQTADTLEQEWTAVELAIFRYEGMAPDQMLTLFVQESEKIKAEQRKREQSLAQPSDQTGRETN